ncbi:hypothetical protein CEXT_493201 [Caerostris extrusa]|uniref:Uncharacterized protein n=1 Tax=Caerostris extrusa TaxID=172846 RepID=A0AAV4VZQ8_CAEEX|nr:hypothetical protein CEXT_493201 [Caerostris extrusa]
MLHHRVFRIVYLGTLVKKINIYSLEDPYSVNKINFGKLGVYTILNTDVMTFVPALNEFSAEGQWYHQRCGGDNSLRGIWCGREGDKNSIWDFPFDGNDITGKACVLPELT